MINEQETRQQLIAALNGGQAYMRFDDAVAQFPLEHINTNPPNVTYSFWHLLEHLRIAQKDILDYIVGTDYVPLRWPVGYWPGPNASTDAAGWNATLDQFRADLAALKAIVNDPATDLTAPLPHAPQHFAAAVN